MYGDKDYDKNGQEKGTYFGAVWCMGLCHEEVRRTRIGLFGVRDGEKVMCKRKPLSAVMYNRGSLCLCGGLRGVRLITPEHAGLYCISYSER